MPCLPLPHPPLPYPPCEQELDLITEKRAIVFVNTKRQCDNVFNHMESLGHR